MDERSRRFDEQRELLILINSLKRKRVSHNGEWWIVDSMHILNGVRLIQVRDLGNSRYEQSAETFVKPKDLIDQNAELIQTYKAEMQKSANKVAVVGESRERGLEIAQGARVVLHGQAYEVQTIFQDMGSVELVSVDGMKKKEVMSIVKLKELLANTTTADSESPERGMVLGQQTGESKNVASGQFESSGTPDPETMEQDVEGQLKVIIDHCDRVVADFVLNNNNKHPSKKEATVLVRSLELILDNDNTNFYRKEYLRHYFAEHDEIRLLRTGKIFSFKTEKGIASFELCVTIKGKFKLNPEKGSVEGVLATQIQNGDDSGQSLT